MLKPPKIFLYYVIVVIVFGVLSYFTPHEGFRIGSSSFRVKWISVDQLFNKYSINTVEDSAGYLKDSIQFSLVDTISDIKDTIAPEVLPVVLDTIVKDSIGNKNILLSYPQVFKKSLYSFYKRAAGAIDSSKVIRVLHMGDSQIEGDRITRYLRESFQSKFKGTGPGLITVYDPQKQFPSVWIRNVGYWSEHAIYNVPRLIKDNQYGLLGRVATIDSVGISKIFISRSSLAQPKASKFYKSRLFLKSIEKPLVVNALWENEKISSDSLGKEDGITEINWTFKEAPQRFSLEFEAKQSPLFLGLSLDSVAGVAVDNIAMRGQSSPRLDKTDTVLYRAMADYMNIGLVILQYGTNMVPTITDNYTFYSRTFYKQLKIIKQTMPNVPVVVVGVGDVASREGGEAKSYQHIYKIKEAQKAAAFKAGFGFFDLFEAMGGEGSMLKWVEEEPRKAMSDYTHFNSRGGEQVASWIYTAIMHDYNNWNNSTTFNTN
ncbi:hypothetical protein E9993_03130 [Labilibacter sediminis]|nr:hypothetical protein E9993_03130 [Labilibacter sediminis]